MLLDAYWLAPPNVSTVLAAFFIPLFILVYQQRKERDKERRAAEGARRDRLGQHYLDLGRAIRQFCTGVRVANGSQDKARTDVANTLLAIQIEERLQPFVAQARELVDRVMKADSGTGRREDVRVQQLAEMDEIEFAMESLVERRTTAWRNEERDRK